MNYNPARLPVIFVLIFFINSLTFAQSGAGNEASPGASNLQDASVAGEPDTLLARAYFDYGNDSILKWGKSREFGYMAFLDSVLRSKEGVLKVDTISINEGSAGKGRRAPASPADQSGGFLNSMPVKFFFRIIALFFIGFIVYRFFMKEGLFAKEQVNYDHKTEEEVPEKLGDFEAYHAFIAQAELHNEYNQAIRYLYLQSLRALTDREFIYFEPAKTNSNYITELSGQEIGEDFAHLTRHYEYAWYGKFLIEPAAYRQIKEKFVSFQKRLSFS